MFALAVWTQSKKRLTLARDRLGIKPFYFLEQGGTFAFASEIRALLECGAARPQLDETGLAGYVKFGSLPDPGTLVEDVKSLGAGEILLTSMDKDGTRNGFDLALTHAVSDAVEVPVIASGGVGNLDHLVQGVTEGHADAVLAAS